MTVDTAIHLHSEAKPKRIARPQHYLMCRPAHFAVTYSINPWMHPENPVDLARALEQWDTLRATYERLGHTVDVIEPAAGLPDMVFAANGGIISDGRAMASQFTFPERQDEAHRYQARFETLGLSPVVQASEQNEGEGDVLRIGEIFLAGTGFRTSIAAHREIEDFFGRQAVSLTLVDPRFYHLDTALAVLDDTTIAYYPPAFAPESQAVLNQLFPDALIATAADADAFGLNAMSDGYNVVTSSQATDLHQQLRARGYNPVGVDMSELLKAGGSAKCCTLEVRP